MLGKITGKKTPEERLNIKTPEDHAKEISALGESADSKSPAEKDRVVANLAEEIQHEDDAGMRRHILRALASYRTPLSHAILQAGLKDSDLEVRRVACESIGRQGGPQAVEELTRVAAADTDVDVRIAAVRALGETEDQAALAPLAEALIDPNPAIQFRAGGAAQRERPRLWQRRAGLARICQNRQIQRKRNRLRRETPPEHLLRSTEVFAAL